MMDGRHVGDGDARDRLHGTDAVSDTGMQALLLAAMLILPIAALTARRLPLSTTVKYAGAWLAIFLTGILIVRIFT